MTGYTTRAMILALMAERSMSLAEFSHRLNLIPEVVAARLGGRGALTVSELRNMAGALSVPLDELTGGAWFGCPGCGAIAADPVLMRHAAACTETDRNGAEQMLPAMPV